MLDYIDYLQQRSRNFVRRGMNTALSGVVPYYIVTEYPKSGGTWLGLMLAELLGVPFPRHRLPGLRPSIIHGHFLPALGMRNIVVLLRDGRDVMISWYFHCTVKYAEGSGILVDIVQRDLRFKDPNDVRANLPRFIEYSFEHQRHPRFSWADFVRAWVSRSDAVFVRYEDLKASPVDELQRVVTRLTGSTLDSDRIQEVVEAHRFEKMAGRPAGLEDRRSFLRKGTTGDWVNYFTPEMRALFDAYAGEELIRLGYEKDSSWVTYKDQQNLPPQEYR